MRRLKREANCGQAEKKQSVTLCSSCYGALCVFRFYDTMQLYWQTPKRRFEGSQKSKKSKENGAKKNIKSKTEARAARAAGGASSGAPSTDGPSTGGAPTGAASPGDGPRHSLFGSVPNYSGGPSTGCTSFHKMYIL
jgi:hypothetical protein